MKKNILKKGFLIALTLSLGLQGFTQVKPKMGAKPMAPKMGAPKMAPKPSAPMNPGQPMVNRPAPPVLSEDIIATKPIFTSIKEGEKAPLNVYRLHLSEVENIEPGIVKFTNLQELIITGTGRPTPSMLPPDFGKLNKLTHLSITNLRVSALPVGFGGLTNLTFLNLTSCGIMGGENELGALIKLKTLKVLGNNFQALPMNLSNATDLTTLETSAMNLPSSKSISRLTYEMKSPMIPPSLSSFTALTYLALKSGSNGPEAPMMPDQGPGGPPMPMMGPPMDFNMAAQGLQGLTQLKTLDLTSMMISDGDLKALSGLNIEELKLGTVRILPGMDGAMNNSTQNYKKLKSISFMSLEAHDERDYQAFNGFINQLPEKESITAPFNPQYMESLSKFKEYHLILQNSRETDASTVNFTQFRNLKGLVVSDGVKNISPTINNSSISDLDISGDKKLDISVLGPTFSQLKTLNRLTVNPNQAKALSSLIKGKTSLTQITITKGFGKGPQREAEEDLTKDQLASLKKAMPTVKIIVNK